MAYETPKLRVTYCYPAVSFASTTTRTFRTPAKMRGKVRFAGLGSTTAFVGTTTPAKVQVGDGTTANKYLDMFMGTAGTPTPIGGAVAASDYASGLVSFPPGLPHLYLDADTVYTVTMQAGVGSPAGVGDVQIVVDYD